MPNVDEHSASKQTAAQGSSDGGRVSAGQLSGAQNPALARLAGAVRGLSAGESPESYSRMHHRHNRS